jgi:hypothetical protein
MLSIPPWLVAALALVVTSKAPMVAATGPAVIMFALSRVAETGQARSAPA